jgi:D-alanyl-D-alanine carboxypeptidase/D-alanyl-D-alanine-endopeptidase (penicillin-binding protein 4)
MKLRLFQILACTAFLGSCSVQKQLQKSAQQYVLNDAALHTAHIGISVYEPATNKYWFNYQGDKYFVPASNTKIPTCYAAMKYLGDSLVGLRYRYQDYLKTFDIIPTGDPTFLHNDFKASPVLNFFKLNIDKKFEFNISNTWFEFPLGSGWSWNDYEANYMAERSPFPIYGNIVEFKKDGEILAQDDSVQGITSYPKFFSKLLHEYAPYGKTEGYVKINRDLSINNFTLRYSASKFTATEIPFVTEGDLTYLRLLSDTIRIKWAREVSGVPLDEEVSFNAGKMISTRGNWAKDLIQDRKDYEIIHSQPTDSLLKPMMHRSDNFFAEQSLLMVSNERLGFMNDAKIIDTILKTDFKDLPQKPRWVDGSGLSRYNLFTPQDMVTILNKMKSEFGMERIKNIFATGNTGTLTNYYKKDSTFIYAKTGTLSGVVALSGFLYTQKGKLLIFSVLVNNHQASATAVRRAVEKFIEGIREQY